MNINSLIKEAVEKINVSEGSRKKVVQKISPLKKENLQQLDSVFLEPSFFQSLAPKELNFRVAGVDSGFEGKRLYSVDLVLVRTTAAIFDYEKNKVVGAHYFPKAFDFPKPFLSTNALENDEFVCSKSLTRLKEEIGTAIETVKEFKPKYFFLDGSIIPQYADKPRKDSKMLNFYRELILLFQKLYAVCEENNCELIGAVEDSRGSRIRKLLQEKILPKKQLIAPQELDNFFDSHLLNDLMQKNERSFVFKYADAVKEHPILADFDNNWSERIFVFYLKPSAMDRPLRLEFLGKKNLFEQANEIASVALSLSCLHKEYAYPSVLIEADLRSRLNQNDIDTVFNKIIDKLGTKNAFMLRRNNRPF